MTPPLGRRHQLVRQMRELADEHEARESRSAVLVEGEIVLAEALEAGLDIIDVLVRDGWQSELVNSLNARGIVTHLASSDAIDAVATTRTPQPVVASVRLPRLSLDQLSPTGMVVVGIELQDPGNVGTIIRSAAAFGATGFVLSSGSADPYAPKAVRAAAGALFRLPVVANQDVGDLLSQLESRGALVATVARGGVHPEKLDLTGSVSLLIGNEANGLDSLVVDRCAYRVTIPMSARTESLNASVAASVVCAEASRQHRCA